MVDPVEADWHHYDAICQAAEDASEASEKLAEENEKAVLTAKSGSEGLPNPLRYRWLKDVFDVASELSAGDGDDATLVADALFACDDDWEEAGLRRQFDQLITSRRDVVAAVGRYAYEITKGVNEK